MNTFCVFFISVFALTTNVYGEQRSPVILVPGDGGSRLDAKIDKSSAPHFYCEKRSDWFNLYVNGEMLIPGAVSCWVSNAKLNYDKTTRKSYSQPGVEVRVPGWGDPEVLEALDPIFPYGPSKYLGPLIEYLVQNGWTKGTSIRAAPYDFRKGPNENSEWFIEMKKLVEETYQMNNNVPVTIICHSMGCDMSHLMLNYQTDDWKEKYIANYITLAGAWGGSVKSLKIFAVGDDLDIPLPWETDYLKPMLISMPSTAFLLPSPYFWNNSSVLVRTPTRDYTLEHLRDFFVDIQYETAWEMLQDQLPFMQKAVEAPNVPVHCIYGRNLDTVEALNYRTNDLINGQPSIVTGDGDGTVNLISLQGCQKWTNQQVQPIRVHEFKNVGHFPIVSEPEVLKLILDILNKKTN